MGKPVMLFDLVAMRVDNLASEELDKLVETCLDGRQFADELARRGIRTEVLYDVDLMDEIMCSENCDRLCEQLDCGIEDKESSPAVRRRQCLSELYSELRFDTDTYVLSSIIDNLFWHIPDYDNIDTDCEGSVGLVGILRNGGIFVIGEEWPAKDGGMLRFYVYVFDKNSPLSVISEVERI